MNTKVLTPFIGTKVILAVQQDATKTDSDPFGQKGYEVVYPDGYRSWSPAGPFEAAYRAAAGPDQQLTFGDAIYFLKLGKRVVRRGWNGKGMWLSLSGPLGGRAISSDKFWSVNNATYAESQPNGEAKVLPCITMKTAAGEILMGWLASQTDILAEDWQVLDD